MKKNIVIGLSFLSLNLFAQNISKYFPDLDTSICFLDSSKSFHVWVDSIALQRELGRSLWVFDTSGNSLKSTKKPSRNLSSFQIIILKHRRLKSEEHYSYEYCLPLNTNLSRLPKPNYTIYEYDVKIKDDTLNSAKFSYAVKPEGRLHWIYEFPVSGSFNFINPIDTVFKNYITEKDSVTRSDLVKVLVNSSGTFNDAKYSYSLRFPHEIMSYKGVSLQGQYFFVVYYNSELKKRQKYWILEAETGRLIEKGFGDFWLEKKDKGLFLNAFIFHDTYHIK